MNIAHVVIGTPLPPFSGWRSKRIHAFGDRRTKGKTQQQSKPSAHIELHIFKSVFGSHDPRQRKAYPHKSSHQSTNPPLPRSAPPVYPHPEALATSFPTQESDPAGVSTPGTGSGQQPKQVHVMATIFFCCHQTCSRIREVSCKTWFRNLATTCLRAARVRT